MIKMAILFVDMGTGGYQAQYWTRVWWACSVQGFHGAGPRNSMLDMDRDFSPWTSIRYMSDMWGPYACDTSPNPLLQCGGFLKTYVRCVVGI